MEPLLGEKKPRNEEVVDGLFERMSGVGRKPAEKAELVETLDLSDALSLSCVEIVSSWLWLFVKRWFLLLEATGLDVADTDSSSFLEPCPFNDVCLICLPMGDEVALSSFSSLGRLLS